MSSRRAPHGSDRRPALVPQLKAFYAAELSAILSYTGNSLLLAPYLSSVAELYADLALDEMEHLRRIGACLCAVGASPYVRACPQPPGYRLQEDADSHAIVLARRMLAASIREEQTAADTYREAAAKAERHPPEVPPRPREQDALPKVPCFCGQVNPLPGSCTQKAPCSSHVARPQEPTEPALFLALAAKEEEHRQRLAAMLCRLERS